MLDLMFRVMVASLLAVYSAPALAETAVVLARVEKVQSLGSGIFDCPTAGTCDGGWRVRVHQVQWVSGPKVKAGASIVLTFHTRGGPLKRNEELLLVLEPIPDESERSLLKADYFVRDWSRGGNPLCLMQEPSVWGLEISKQALLADSEGVARCISRDALLRSGT